MIIGKVCVFIFKRTARGYEFLILRRSEKYGLDIWQPVTGHLEKNENFLEAAKREVLEETGISQFIRSIDPDIVINFSNSESNKKYKEKVYGFEVSPDIEEVQLSDEHRSFSWVNCETARALLYWDNNKESLKAICDRIKA